MKEMKSKGFILTGVLFGLAIILLISTNYFLLSSPKNADYLVLQVDAVGNRKTDVRRIIQAAINNDNCTNLNTLLDSSLLDSDGVEVDIKNIDLTTCPNPTMTISINTTNVYEELTYP